MMELIRTSGSEWVTDGFEKKKKKKISRIKSNQLGEVHRREMGVGRGEEGLRVGRSRGEGFGVALIFSLSFLNGVCFFFF